MVCGPVTAFELAGPCWGAEAVKTAGGRNPVPEVLNYGVLNTINGVNVDDARVAIELNFVRQSPGWPSAMKVKLTMLQDAGSAADMIQKKELHALSATGIDYLVLRELAPVKALSISSRWGDNPLEAYVLVVKKDLDWKKLAARGQRRLMVESNRYWDIGRIWLETVMHDLGLPKSDQFFTAVQIAEKPARQVLPVFFGQAEACLVSESIFNTMVELNPQIGQKLRVLRRSPGFANNIVCVAEDLNPDFVSIMADNILNMHKNADTHQILLIAQVKRNFPFREDYLDETEQVYQKYLALNSGKTE